MDLTMLPDDALLEVLRYVDTRDLLQCRGVCRRLRDAALHPHLWQKKELRSYDSGKELQLVAATLRLAPCLGRLTLDSYGDPFRQLGTLLVSTRCAISELDVRLSSASAVLVAMALARQAALGRLKTFSLSCWTCKQPEVRLLLDQLLHTRGLTSIAVKASGGWNALAIPQQPSLAKAAKGDAVAASLRRLEFTRPDCSLPAFLQRHADTLEVVHLSEMEFPADTTALLVALPRLRELKCPVFDDMLALLQCPALDTLCLMVMGVDDLAPPVLLAVQQYLRQASATRLEALTLVYCLEQEDLFQVLPDSADLVRCLAGPDRRTPSALRSLSLSYDDEGSLGDAWEPQPQLPLLASVLPRLQNLVSLDLGGPLTEEFLEAMDGRVLPRLERLRIVLPHPDGKLCSQEWAHGGKWCPHEWAHGEKPRGLLCRYPRLHVEVKSRHEMCGCAPVTSCGYCEAHSCHSFEGETVYTLFSHPEDMLCKQEHKKNGLRVLL